MDLFDFWFDDTFPERAFKRLNRLLSIRVPAVDVKDEGDKIKVIVDLPGMKKEDIHVRADEDKIVIKAEKEKSKENEGGDYLIQERSNVSYYRVIPLPEYVDPDSAKARYKDGELEIELNKIKGKRKKEVNIE